MLSRDQSGIVADGRERILKGTGKELANRFEARLIRRVSPMLERAGPVGRLVIRFRVRRFIRWRLEKHAPFEALYSGAHLKGGKRFHPD